MLAKQIMLIGSACLMIIINSRCLAQNITEYSPSAVSSTSESVVVRTKLAKTVFLGLAGSVLGLSTLSFYGKPEEHLSNVVTGFGIGLVLGVVYVAYETALDLNTSNTVKFRTKESWMNTSPELSTSPKVKLAPELWTKNELNSKPFSKIEAPLFFIQF